MIHVVRVGTRDGKDARGSGLLEEIRSTLGIRGISGIRTVRVYRLEGCEEAEARTYAETVLVETINEKWAMNAPLITNGQHVEIGYKPGVMNPEVASMMKAARDLGILSMAAADSSTEYHFTGEIGESDLERIVNRLLMNATVERVIASEPKTLTIEGRRGIARAVPIRDLDDDGLMAVSSNRQLHLNLTEMIEIRDHFRLLERDPTDVEIETLAQTWSEHCVHKTFKAPISLNMETPAEPFLPGIKVYGVKKQPLFQRIKETASAYMEGVVSAFEDNSGVFDFYDGYAICGKVETHNSPSAIEPYGGAATGSGGVFRDIIGTGEGAKCIISTDMFCFAPPNLPDAELPEGCLHPRYLLRRVVAGVRDYGNRMGIPTSNGSVHFHPDFRAKPTVIVGSYGMIPVAKAKKGIACRTDLVLALGGRTGRDGIHGATFSSGEMTDQTITVNSSAVQIGNAIEEKRTADAILELRDRGMIRAITDCGAGGFSSAIGEMGSKTGIDVDLDCAPLKYQGLDPWEIWVSESQERMVIAISPDLSDEAIAICRRYNVEATVLGSFTDTKRLVVRYGNEIVCDLDMDFLHNGVPIAERKAQAPVVEMTDARPPIPENSEAWKKAFLRVLADGNVCSKEPIVRQYDHTVQGMNALPPYNGGTQDGPNDALIVTPIRGKPYGLIVAHGMNPILNRYDPYRGTVWACVEALSNYVAAGGDVANAYLINNYIWPYPDEESLGTLDASVDAVCDVMRAFKRPVISGKDSLSSTYRKGGLVIKIPPVLCLSVMGKVEDVEKTLHARFSESGNFIVLIGVPDTGSMGGSVYAEQCGVKGRVPGIDLARQARTFRLFTEAMNEGLLLSAHDVSEGGIGTAVAEMCFGTDLGADIYMSAIAYETPLTLFNETAGCFIVEVDGDGLHELQHLSIPLRVLGVTREQPMLRVNFLGEELFTIEVDVLKQAWTAPMKEVFR